MKKLIALIVGSGVCVSAWGQGNLIRNGYFEQANDNSWELVPGTVDSSVQSRSVSPFTNFFPPSQRALELDDDIDWNGIYGYPQMEQRFTPQASGVYYSFDVRYAGANSGNADGWGVSVGSLGFTFAYEGLIVGNFHYSMNSGAWYQIQGSIDVVNKVATGYIIPFGGEPVAFQRTFTGNVGPVSRFGVADDVAGGGIAGRLYLDNISVMPIPEPSTIGLLGLGGLVLGWCMRSTKAKARSAPGAEFRS